MEFRCPLCVWIFDGFGRVMEAERGGVGGGDSMSLFWILRHNDNHSGLSGSS